MADFFAKKNIIRQRPVVKYIRNDGADKQSHSHPHPEFVFIVSGSGRMETENKQYPIKTGDLLIYSKGIAHSEYLFDIQGSEIYHLGFDKTVLSGMDENEIISEPFCIIHTDSQFELFKAYFTAIYNEETNKQLCSKAIESDLMKVLLLSALRLAVCNMASYAQNRSFFEAKDYFDKNYITIDSIEQACKKLGINKFYLTHIFKEQLGIPPIKYLVLKRMEKAKGLLTTSTLSISEIAEKCGYNDTAYFCRVFKKTENTTPLQYRIKIKRENKNPNNF